MTTWGEAARLSLVWDRTKRHVQQQARRLKTPADRKALRSEFTEWFATEWDDLEIQWMEDYKKW